MPKWLGLVSVGEVRGAFGNDQKMAAANLVICLIFRQRGTILREGLRLQSDAAMPQNKMIIYEASAYYCIRVQDAQLSTRDRNRVHALLVQFKGDVA